MDRFFVDCRRRHGSFAAGDFALPDASPQYPPDLELEPAHLDLTLRFDPLTRTLDGVVVTTAIARRAGARALALEARDFEDVQVRDPDGHSLSHRYDGRRIEVQWDDPFARDEERRVEIGYRVVDPSGGLHFSLPDDIDPDRPVWVATDHETERARYWLPCVDYPAVRTTLAFHITAPGGLTILANGVCERHEENGDGTATAHWRLDQPCPSYLVCIAIGDFVRSDDEPVDGRPIAYFAVRGRADEADLARSFGRTPEMMRWLEQRLGTPFPYPKYFQFAIPGFGGAMENISLVSWDDVFVTDEVAHREFGYLTDIVNVHEMAHSWFGDSVVVRDFAHAWLKESWATYLEACWYEQNEGDDAFRYDLFRCARAYMKEADESYMRPIVTRTFNSSWDMYDRHLYPGGACRIHMLRRRLGEEPFWGAVTDYLATWAGRTVETDDFRRMLEKHSGLSLVEFFDQWLHGIGYPKLKLTFAHDADKGQGTFTLEQTQAAKEGGKAPANAGTDDKPKPGVFRFPAVIAWESGDGEWQRHEFEVRRRTETVVVPMEAPPLQIRFDPDGALLHRLECSPGVAMLRRAVCHAPDAVGRIQAAEELVKTGKRTNFDAVAAAYRDEPFWGVRQAVAQAVGESGHAAAIDLLCGFIAGETDPRVLATAAAQAGGYRDPRIAAVLRERLGGDITYRAAAAGLRSLGRQRGADHLDLLTVAADDRGHRCLVRAGALAGLAETRSAEALDLLAARVAALTEPGNAEPDDSAPAAVAALAAAARFADRPGRQRVAEMIADLLRDPRDRVRMSAAVALKTLSARDAVPAIEAFRRAVPEQYEPVVRRIVRAIRGDGDDRAPTAALEKRIDELEDRVRGLQDELARRRSEEETEGGEEDAEKLRR